MDVMFLLKAAPGVVGLAGLLTHIMMRGRETDSDLELVNSVRRARNMFVVLGCVTLIILSAWLIFQAAPPEIDTSLLDLAAGPYRTGAETVIEGHGPGPHLALASQFPS